MNGEKAKNAINEQIDANLGSFNKPVVPVHKHNGADSLQIQSSDLLPYTIDSTFSSNIYMTITGIVGVFVVGETITGGTSGATADVVVNNGGTLTLIPSGFFVLGETITGGTSGATAMVGSLSNTSPNDSTISGTIGLYEFLYSSQPTSINPITDTDWGIQIFLGNQWNEMTIVSSGVEANQDTAQNFASVTEEKVIFDSPTYDLNFEYDSTTGDFTCTTKGRYLISGAVSFQDLSGLTGTIELTAYYEFNGTPFALATKSIYIPAGITNGDVVTVDLTTIQEIPATSLVYVTIYQTTGSPLTSLTNPRTWFNVHKMK